MMKETIKTEIPEKGINRLETFSDGVFAIAITLLGLEMKVLMLEKTPNCISVNCIAIPQLHQNHNRLLLQYV
jgi:uncharacterized membrane protein